MPLPPITQSNISTEWSTNFFTVILTTNEPCDTYYTVDGSSPISSPTRALYQEPFTIETEGVHTVQFYSISLSSGIQNLVQTHFVRIDNSPPITSINVSIQPDGEDGWYVTLPTIALSAIDNVSGVNKTMYSWDGAAFQEYTGGNLIIPDEGIHYLQVYSLDSASNKEEVQTRVFKYDISAPTTSIRTPLEVSYTPVTIEFVPSDSASGYATTYYTTDGTTPTFESDAAPSFDIDESGLYIVKYFSVDNAGNIEPVKESGQVRVEIDPESIQILLTESFPINGKNGWYRSSPQIGILTTKPHLVTSLEYKVAPKEKPTTATYTSTVEITGEIDLSDGSFIGIEVDQSGELLVINVRGTDSTKTTIDDIIGKINDTFGGDTPIASETGSDGLEGTGYVTITSPTGGTGSPTSEIKFDYPGTFDATAKVFGLDIDNYPHTFTETYLYVAYTAPFLLPGNGYWNVEAKATTSTEESTTTTKDYRVDSTAPLTIVNVVPDPNPEGFYTTSPDITFSTTDEDSGIDRIVYQFDNGPVFEYHPEDGSIQLPLVSKEIILRYFSVDIAGNSEAPKIASFNYDFLAPVTKFDINAVNLDSQNILDIMFCPAQIVKYNPYTDEYEFVLTPQQRENLSYFAGWTNDLNSRLYDETTPITFNVDTSTDIFTFIPLYDLATEDIVRVSSTGDLPTPLQPATDYFIISISDTECKLAATLLDAQNNIAINITDEGTGIHQLIPDSPTIIVFDPLKVYLWPIDDREYVIENETVAAKDDVVRELTVENGFLKHVISIYNQTTLQPMTYRYFSDDKIYTVESFANTDTIIVNYAYTKIRETHYTINDTTPTTLSPEGHIIELRDSGTYTLKWFSIDEAGNQEAVQTFPATIVIINRAPTVSVEIVKHNDTGILYNPNGTNDWYKLDESEPLLRPAVKITYSSPEVSVFNENPSVESITGSGPYDVELRVLKVDDTVEEISDVTQVRNVTKAEIYAIVSYGGSGTEDRIFTTAVVSPDPGDIFEVDYKFNTVLDSNPDGKILKIGNPSGPDVSIDFSAETSPYIYELPSGYNIQGAKQITVVVKDLREAVTVVDEVAQLTNDLLKLDVDDPITVDNVVPGWVATDVVVTLTAVDPIPPAPYEFPSGMYRIYYSTDGSFPNTLYGAGSTVQITLSVTGQYQIKYRGIDNAGNDEAVKTSSTVQIDKIAPTTTIAVVPPDGFNGWYKTSPSIVLNAIDLDSGIDKTYYKWDDDVFVEYTASLLIPTEGIHILHYYSVDNVGNEEVHKQQEFKLDTIAPVTTDDITGDWTNNQIIKLSVLDDSSGPYRSHYTFALLGDPLPDPTLFSPYTETFEIAIPASGVYNVKYFSLDNAGNQEAVQIAPNQFQLDLTKPAVVAIDPPDLVFTTQTHLTVDFTDTFSGLDIDTVRIVVDDIEYSTSKNSSFFSYTGTPFATQVKIGPVASIPNFDKLESVVIYASDFAGNNLDPVVIQVIPVDNEPPYLRRFWPRDKANDVSRNTNVMFEINDDISTVDIRTVKVKIAETTYQLNTTEVIEVIYSGSGTQVFIDIRNHSLFLTVDGIVVANINLTHEDYETCKKVATYIDNLSGFSTNINRENDQIPSIDLVGLYHVLIDPQITLSVAPFEDNVHMNYMPRDRGYLITVTPSETFDDKLTVITTVDAEDFSGNVMPTEQYMFTCRDITTPSREVKYRWYDSHVDIINRIKSNMESTYNKYTDSSVFHGYFRALALEIARSMQIAEDYRDDTYYEGGTTRSSLLYQNIGYLLKTTPREEYTHDEYKQILMAVMFMLFHGSTKESLLAGLGVFLGISGLKITENSLVESSDIAQQFGFTFDVAVADEPIRSWEDFNESIDSVLRLVKPAHTYFLIRYLFSEIVRTKDIVDEIVKWHFEYYGSEDVRTDCAEKYKVAETITEDVSNQFSGSENCCTAFYTPILSWDETTITNTPSDIQVSASGGPINVISVDGFTGDICFDRNPGPAETVEIIYKFNKYVIYRKIGFYLNTYTLTGGGFDPAEPYLLNQTGNPVTVIIAYDNPEELHAHICETGLFIDVHYPVSEKIWRSPTEEMTVFDVADFEEEVVDFDVRSQLTSIITDLTEKPFKPIRENLVSVALTFSDHVDPLEEEVFSSLNDFKEEIVDFDVKAGYSLATNADDDATILQPVEAMTSITMTMSEQTNFLIAEYGEAEETNAEPFETNDPNSLLNTPTDMLFFLIKRVFGGS